MSDDFQYDAFLSHSSKDKAIVRAVAERLQADGLRVWLDEWVLKPGDNLPKKLDDGLEASRVLVLFMSANAFGSDWAQLEAGTFRFRDPLNRERRFIPLRLDEAPIKGSLAQFLYIDWLSEDREREYKKLLEACRPSANQTVIEGKVKAQAKRGKTGAREQPSEPPSEQQIKRNLALKRRMEKDFLRPLDRRATWPYEKFAHSEVIIHSIDDKSYPGNNEQTKIRGWFKAEVWNFYFNGLEVIIRPEAGVINKIGEWAVVGYNQEYDASRYTKVTLIRVGRIPWRNIIEYDLGGDEYYRFPHIYCNFADNDTPYECVEYYYLKDERYRHLERNKQLHCLR